MTDDERAKNIADALAVLAAQQRIKSLGQSYAMPGAPFTSEDATFYQIPTPGEYERGKLPPAVGEAIRPYAHSPEGRQRGDHLSGRPDWPEGPMYGPPGYAGRGDKHVDPGMEIKPDDDDPRKRGENDPASGTWSEAPDPNKMFATPDVWPIKSAPITHNYKVDFL